MQLVPHTHWREDVLGLAKQVTRLLQVREGWRHTISHSACWHCRPASLVSGEDAVAPVSA